MAEIEQFIDPQAEAQIEKYLANLQGIATSYDKIFTAAVKTEQAITKISRSSDDAEKKQRKTNEAAKEAERIAKEQAKAAEALEKQRQAAINAMGVQEAKQRQLAAAMQMEVKSVNDAIAQNKALRAERNKVDATTESGQKKLAELNGKINQNTEYIRKNNDASGKQAMNIGNYKSALEGLPGPLGNVTRGAAGLGKQLWALVANPIVAIVAALVLGLMALYNVFKSTDDGATKLTAIFDGMNAILDVVKNRIVTLIESFSALFKGNFKEAGEKFKDTFSGMGEEMANAAKSAYDLAYALDDLEDRMTANISKAADYENRIAKLYQLSKDQTKSDGERKKALKEALDLERELADDKVKFATEQYDLDVKTWANKKGLNADLVKSYIAMDAEQMASAIQTNKAYADIQNRLNGDGVKALEESYAKMRAADTEYYTSTNRLQAQYTGFERQINEERKRQHEELIKQKKDSEKQANEELKTNYELDLKQFDRINKSKITSETKLTDELIYQEEDRLLKRAAIQDKLIDLQIATGQIKEREAGIMKMALTDEIETAIGELKIKMAEQTAAEELRIEKEKQEQIKAQIAEQVEFEKRMHDVRNNNILRALAQGQISRKQAEDQQKENDFQTQAAILQSTMSTIQKQIDAEQVGSEKRAELVGQLMDKQTEMETLRLEYDLWTQDQRTEKIISSLETIQNVTNEISSIAQGFFQAQSEQLDAEKERQLAAAGENAARREQIEKEFAIKQAQLKRKQAIAEKATGVFNIGINTAMSIVKTGAELGYPAAIPFQVLAGILGAAQMAVVLSKPLPEIPKFAKGTKSAPGGLSLVGEAGRELLYKDGKAQLVSKPTLVDLTKGTQVLTNRETERILQHAAMGKTGYDSQMLRSSIEQGNKDVINAIQNKRELLISASGDKITERSGNYYKTYFNRKIRWAGK